MHLVSRLRIPPFSNIGFHLQPLTRLKGPLEVMRLNLATQQPRGR